MVANLKIMVVDDEETICEALAAWFSKDGYQVETATSGKQALIRMSDHCFDIFVLDIKMPEMDGMELLSRIREIQADADVIMITAHGSIQTAVEAMKRGASDYFCKPFDADELSLLMERVAANRALRDENRALKEQLSKQQEALIDGFVAQSNAMQAVVNAIEEIGPATSPVLILGATGVGKDLVARAIHFQSEQAYGPFVAINCGSLTETLLESELFGHERGAFSGAVKARRGRLEMADNGTLFLDEIGEISSKMQVALLRVLEEKKFQRVGGTKSIPVNFRLISATHRDLLALIQAGTFREDFYYRINVISLEIPPLKDRPEDLPLLAEYFLDQFTRETGKRLEGFTQRALGMLMTYDWPGNVRELRNVIERAVVLAKGRMIGAEELTFLHGQKHDCGLGSLTLKEVEVSHIRATLEAFNWNISQAARQLGINRSTLSRKIKAYQLNRKKI